MRVSENKMLSGMFGFKRQQVTRGWRKVHKEQLHFFTYHQMYGVPIKEEIVGRVARIDNRNAFQLLGRRERAYGRK